MSSNSRDGSKNHEVACYKQTFRLILSTEFDPPHMMYDAAVAIGFAARAQVYPRSPILRDQDAAAAEMMLG